MRVPNYELVFTPDQWLKAAQNMEARGGHFASALGRAMIHADGGNRDKICFVFHDLIRRFLDD